jgi:hypothetical protein
VASSRRLAEQSYELLPHEPKTHNGVKVVIHPIGAFSEAKSDNKLPVANARVWRRPTRPSPRAGKCRHRHRSSILPRPSASSKTVRGSVPDKKARPYLSGLFSFTAWTSWSGQPSAWHARSRANRKKAPRSFRRAGQVREGGGLGNLGLSRDLKYASRMPDTGVPILNKSPDALSKIGAFWVDYTA